MILIMPKPLPITNRFGMRMRELRRARHLSQEDLAELCGLDRTYISGVERGQRNIALRNIEALAQALDVSLADLFKDI